MVAIIAGNKVAGITEGHTLTVDSQHGVLAGDKDLFGFPPTIAAVRAGSSSVGVSGGLATVKGTYGTLVMHADGSYSYAANNNISLPANGIVQDSFTFTIANNHGHPTQATLTLTVMQPGLSYVAGTPGQTLTGRNSSTVFDASLGHQTVVAGNGDDVLIGGTDDVLTASNGNDTIIGGSESAIKLGDGNDTVIGGSENVIKLGDGDDTVTGGSENVIKLGDGNDTVIGGSENVIKLGDGDDMVTGGSQNVIKLGDGNDTVTGGSDDVIKLGNGSDNVVAGANDIIVLGNGKDKITVGADNTITVGKGADTFIFNQTEPASIGNDTISGFSPTLDRIQFSTTCSLTFRPSRRTRNRLGQTPLFSPTRTTALL